PGGFTRAAPAASTLMRARTPALREGTLGCHFARLQLVGRCTHRPALVPISCKTAMLQCYYLPIEFLGAQSKLHP
ncbi:MAG: hypothetical protein ACRD3W_07205, partial [Terriglobales bacterium]